MEFAKYRVIHWFFDKQALEFLNIGIVVFSDDGEFIFKIIDDDLLAKIKANFISKSVLSYTINHIRSFLEKCKSESDLENALKSEYKITLDLAKLSCFVHSKIWKANWISYFIDILNTNLIISGK